ncbi:MAG TPA: DUF4236 domain-containing protein [Gemmatimonadaceae bacterium]|nr:DUF4236 domain-containing protein [Gemmatimonadaceae bacterium]
MGFSIRQSVRVGPLRFNLSKSGVGVSAGVPGFRVGMGPRGNYVHAGRGGFYYRATLPSHRTARPAPGPSFTQSPRATLQPSLGRPTLGPDVEIESGPVVEMRDESAEGLLAELIAKRSLARFGPLVLVLAVLAFAFASLQLLVIGQLLVGVVAVTATVTAFITDTMRKTTVILYEFDTDAEASFQGLDL